VNQKILEVGPPGKIFAQEMQNTGFKHTPPRIKAADGGGRISIHHRWILGSPDNSLSAQSSGSGQLFTFNLKTVVSERFEDIGTIDKENKSKNLDGSPNKGYLFH